MKSSGLQIVLGCCFLLLLIWACVEIQQDQYLKFSWDILRRLEGGSLGQQTLKTISEGLLVSPMNPKNLRQLKELYDMLKPLSTRQIDQYVTFTRLNTNYTQRMSCDFCSIANGIIHFGMDSARDMKRPYSLSKAQVQTLQQVKERVLSILVFRRTSRQELIEAALSYSAPYTDNPLLYHLKQIDFLLTQIELRWCPFQAMTLYYRNNDPRYLPINKQNIYEAGRILSQNDTIECYSCSR